MIESIKKREIRKKNRILQTAKRHERTKNFNKMIYSRNKDKNDELTQKS